jgi:alkanesulfonate monooxygenase SsuD/methylene tetrahydromethanopterin reductase-like flavin-dependent oxidoreductase (luciferase family)
MLDEALTVIRRLWREESVTFEGRFYTLTDALCEPKPVQQPHRPSVIGGEKPKMLRVVARHADEWNVPSDGDQRQPRRGMRGDRPGSGGDQAIGAAVHPACRGRAIPRRVRRQNARATPEGTNSAERLA